MPPTPKNRSGMTLMEILVVLVIIAMGWFAFMPALDVGGRFREADRLEDLNKFMETVRTAAFKKCAIQKIQVVLGEDSLTWNEEKISLPGGVSRCLINGENPGGLTFDFNMYPAGVMDEVRLVLLNGIVLEGGVLSGKFEL
ncbi:MAG: type II secretion system protein [Thermodesulfobacteriota bacterium]|nr:type II secretion system protein [Thermodesulfobacteriota bacterium]